MSSESTHSIAMPTQSPAFLEVHEERGVRVFLLGRSIMRIGSKPGSDVHLQDSTVSQHHADVIWFDGAYWVVDAGSKNGIYAGGARVDRARLLPGAVVCIGAAVLVACTRADTSPNKTLPLPGVAGTSAAMLHVAAQVRALSSLPHPVLVVGETGTGKELIARALHAEGARAARPFVALNVANLPRDLIEAELFGHERGAFTGAEHARAGAFAEAHRGTLFLDEIAELPREAQPKLLRVLDGYGARRLGAEGPSLVHDARVVAATHVSLMESVQRGEFRRDLFHRLEVHVVRVPSLRERRTDIPAIARLMLAGLKDERLPKLTASAVAQLMNYAWPGNVRELRNVLLRAVEAAREEGVIRAAHVLLALGHYSRPSPEVTRAAAERCYQEYGANLTRAARASGVPRTTFRRRLEEAAKTAAKK